MLAKINSSSLHGIEARNIKVEVSVTNGLGYIITGLPDDGIKESLSRIAIAIQSNGFQMPRTKLVINLGPADSRKTGSAFDLPIALGILQATEQITDVGKLDGYMIVGELGLDGSVFPVRGALCMAWLARRDHFKGILLPEMNAREAALVDGISVYAIRHLKDVLNFIQADFDSVATKITRLPIKPVTSGLDFRDVRGQQRVKRALEIAAAGGHNALIIGSPGIGKTMLARRLPSILPPLSMEEALETTRIHSITGQHKSLGELIWERPFRSPHHTTSDVALVGGGNVPVPGEISLAHNGVLFLDELPEFKRGAIEVLRQPLEERKVLISRAKCSLEFPASFMLLAAMNPCLCGFFGHPTRKCTCSKRAIYWYRRRISSPLLERIDLHIEAESPLLSELIGPVEPSESSSVIRDRVMKSRKIQHFRFKNEKGIFSNAMMSDPQLEKHCALESHATRFLLKQMEVFQLSARSYARILKVSRTISDLAGMQQIALEHIAEAISFRSLDKPLNTGTEKQILKPLYATGLLSHSNGNTY